MGILDRLPQALRRRLTQVAAIQLVLLGALALAAALLIASALIGALWP